MMHLVWIVAAGVLGFLIAALFAGWLRIGRSLLLVPYVLLNGLLVARGVYL